MVKRSVSSDCCWRDEDVWIRRRCRAMVSITTRQIYCLTSTVCHSILVTKCLG